MDEPNSAGFTGEILDRYLAAGWYRMSARMFTCRYSFIPNGFLTTVWTRLPLADHTFPKSLRRLLRRNGAQFRTETHPARAGEDEENVFAAYRAEAPYDLNRSAAQYLLHDPDVPFDTWQISVYAGEELIAFSYFDRGHSAVQSLGGYYLPAARLYSPGLYTLALEIEQAKRWGMDYHYSGYLVPGNEVFEYKRRVGALEAFDDVSKQWYPLAKMDPDQLPDVLQRAALLEFDRLYRSIGVSYGVRLRPTIQIPFGRESLGWLRREQLAFCVVDASIVQHPFWACHLYSYNLRRYCTLLCTRTPYGNPETAFEYEPGPPPPLTDSLQERILQLDPGVGIALECLYYSSQPYTPATLTRIAEAVTQANASMH